MALVGNGAGYKPRSVYNALRNCNGIAAINMQMLSILTGVKDAMIPVRDLHQHFIDCLPIIHNWPIYDSFRICAGISAVSLIWLQQG